MVSQLLLPLGAGGAPPPPPPPQPVRISIKATTEMMNMNWRCMALPSFSLVVRAINLRGATQDRPQRFAVVKATVRCSWCRRERAMNGRWMTFDHGATIRPLRLRIGYVLGFVGPESGRGWRPRRISRIHTDKKQAGEGGQRGLSSAHAVLNPRGHKNVPTLHGCMSVRIALIMRSVGSFVAVRPAAGTCRIRSTVIIAIVFMRFLVIQPRVFQKE